jgi:hypothetical protein
MCNGKPSDSKATIAVFVILCLAIYTLLSVGTTKSVEFCRASGLLIQSKGVWLLLYPFCKKIRIRNVSKEAETGYSLFFGRGNPEGERVALFLNDGWILGLGRRRRLIRNDAVEFVPLNPFENKGLLLKFFQQKRENEPDFEKRLKDFVVRDTHATADQEWAENLRDEFGAFIGIQQIGALEGD